MFNVSTETIRKDVADLSEKKYSRRDMELFFLPVVILKIHFLIKYRKCGREIKDRKLRFPITAKDNFIDTGTTVLQLANVSICLRG